MEEVKNNAGEEVGVAVGVAELIYYRVEEAESGFIVKLHSDLREQLHGLLVGDRTLLTLELVRDEQHH